MATYKQLMVLANDQNFQSRVKYAMQNAAIAVMAEGTGVTAHTTRVAYAAKVLSGSASVYECAVGILNNSTIAAEVTSQSSDSAVPDTDIQFAMNSDFNAFAGIG